MSKHGPEVLSLEQIIADDEAAFWIPVDGLPEPPVPENTPFIVKGGGYWSIRIRGVASNLFDTPGGPIPLEVDDHGGLSIFEDDRTDMVLGPGRLLTRLGIDQMNEYEAAMMTPEEPRDPELLVKVLEDLIPGVWGINMQTVGSSCGRLYIDEDKRIGLKGAASTWMNDAIPTVTEDDDLHLVAMRVSTSTHGVHRTLRHLARGGAHSQYTMMLNSLSQRTTYAPQTVTFLHEPTDQDVAAIDAAIQRTKAFYGDAAVRGH